MSPSLAMSAFTCLISSCRTAPGDPASSEHIPAPQVVMTCRNEMLEGFLLDWQGRLCAGRPSLQLKAAARIGPAWLDDHTRCCQKSGSGLRRSGAAPGSGYGQGIHCWSGTCALFQKHAAAGRGGLLIRQAKASDLRHRH